MFGKLWIFFGDQRHVAGTVF